MKQSPRKSDDVDVLPANTWNSANEELENAVLNSSQTLDSTSETSLDPDPTQLGRAITLGSQVSNQYRDVGAVNAYVLNRIGSFRQPTAYVNGMTVTFKVGITNTGPSTVNIESLGVRNIVSGDGSTLNEGDLLADTYVTIRYALTEDRFEVVNSEGRQIVGVQIKDEGAVVADEIQIINIIGAGVTAEASDTFEDQINVTVSTPTLTIQQDGTPVGAAATTINFVGAAVAGAGSVKTITFTAGDTTPPGTVVDFAGMTVPDGWLICHGASHLQASFPNLFAAIGTIYGGDATTFRVPDCRGRATRGWDNRTEGDGDPNRVFGSLQEDELRSHTHVLRGNDRGDNTNQLRAPGLYFDDAEGFSVDPRTIQPAGGVETRMKNIAFNKIIKT